MRARLCVTTALLATSLASPAFADVYYMLDGDRITGKTLSQAAGQYRVQTVYGRVNIPKGRIQKIVHDDGREEIVSAPALAPAPEPTPAPALHLLLVVTGASFWQAWSPSKEQAAPDPTLRLVVSLDEETLATYTDPQLDPDIPGALVNAFSFDAAQLVVQSADGVEATPPEARPGRISLRVNLPAGLAGERRLRVAYQSNDGSAADPAWRDVVESAIHAELKLEAANVVRLHQDRGHMEFSGFARKKMKNVETFRIELGME